MKKFTRIALKSLYLIWLLITEPIMVPIWYSSIVIFIIVYDGYKHINKPTIYDFIITPLVIVGSYLALYGLYFSYRDLMDKRKKEKEKTTV